MTERVTLMISEFGIGGGGALAVERRLIHMPGVTRAFVSPVTEVAYVEYDPGVVSPADLVKAINEIGLFVEGAAIRR